MSDTLSQDQLEALLGASDDTSGGQPIGGDDEGDEGPGKNYDALASAFAFFNEKAGAVIGNVINRETKLEVSQCAAVDAAVLKKSVPSSPLMATITLEGALDGTMCMIFETGTAAMLADLMLMGDGTAEYNDDHKDAIGELINQMMGSYTTAMGEKLGGSVSTGAIQVQEFDFSKPPVSLQGGDMALLKVKVDGQSDSVIGVFIPGALSDVLMENFVAGPAEDASGLEGHEKGVGLSGAELDELSQVATDFSDGSGGNSGFSKGSGSFSGSGNKSVEMLLDVELDVSIELGRTNLSIKRVLELSAGSIVELDRMAGEPVDLLVNDKVVAKGEVVVVDENFGIRIVSLVSPEERIKSLK